MPNICTNKIKISGSQSEITELKNYFKVEDDSLYLDLDKIATEFELGDYEYVTGTRWFEFHDNLTLFDNTDAIEFEASTAWSPCVMGFQSLSSKYKTLKIHYQYSESSVGFCGHATIANGVVDDELFTITDADTTEYYKLMIELEYDSIADYVDNLDIDDADEIDEDLPEFVKQQIRKTLIIMDYQKTNSTESLKSIMARFIPKIIVIIGCEYNYKVLFFEGEMFDSNAAFITKKLADYYELPFIDKAKESGDYFLNISEKEMSLLIDKFTNEFEIKAEIKIFPMTEKEIQKLLHT
jgi:Ferredoxin-like domain in Api92-like protein